MFATAFCPWGSGYGQRVSYSPLTFEGAAVAIATARSRPGAPSPTRSHGRDTKHREPARMSMPTGRVARLADLRDDPASASLRARGSADHPRRRRPRRPAASRDDSPLTSTQRQTACGASRGRLEAPKQPGPGSRRGRRRTDTTRTRRRSPPSGPAAPPPRPS